jgi:hypothetical protein
LTLSLRDVAGAGARVVWFGPLVLSIWDFLSTLERMTA